MLGMRLGFVGGCSMEDAGAVTYVLQKVGIERTGCAIASPGGAAAEDIPAAEDTGEDCPGTLHVTPMCLEHRP